jgi:hypothetical protein
MSLVSNESAGRASYMSVVGMRGRLQRVYRRISRILGFEDLDDEITVDLEAGINYPPTMWVETDTAIIRGRVVLKPDNYAANEWELIKTDCVLQNKREMETWTRAKTSYYLCSEVSFKLSTIREVLHETWKTFCFNVAPHFGQSMPSGYSTDLFVTHSPMAVRSGTDILSKLKAFTEALETFSYQLGLFNPLSN